MPDLSVRYLGLALRNPIIVAASSLTKSVEGLQRCEEAGAGAVVLKSLFEEQIDADTQSVEQHLWMGDHPEAFEYVRGMGMELGPREYLELVEQGKRKLGIPVIASLNCVSPRWWLDYAAQLASAGADALELNISALPSDLDRDGRAVEALYLDVLRAVRERVKLPVAVKIGPYFSALGNMAQQLSEAGAAGLVLFNRFYQVDIDAERMDLAPGYRFSAREELNLPLRWVGLLAGKLPCDLAVTTGVHRGEDAVKALLAGAQAVQVCSTLYLNGLEQIGRIVAELEAWMERKGFADLAAFRGRCSQDKSAKSELYERLQYVKALVGVE